MDELLCSLFISPCFVLSAIMSQLFTARDHLQIFDYDCVPSTLEAGPQSLKAGSGLYTVCAKVSVVKKLYAVCTMN
jgi:hypothetical protein